MGDSTSNGRFVSGIVALVLMLTLAVSIGLPTDTPAILLMIFSASFLIVFYRQLATPSFFASYYFFLVILYFPAGYFGMLSVNDGYQGAILRAKYYTALIQLVPFFLLLGWSIFERERKFIWNKYWLLVFFVIYILVVNEGNLNQSLVVQLRNFVGPIVAFLLGCVAARRIQAGVFFKYLFVISWMIVLFGFFEYVVRWGFWVDYFPARFVSDIKGFGTFENGVVGNKVIGINGVPYYRMSSFLYSPQHAAYNFVFFLVFFLYAFRFKIISIHPRGIKYIYLLIMLTCVVLTLIKSAWGQLAISIFVLTLCEFKTVRNRIRRFKLPGIILMFGVMILTAILLLTLYLQLGLSSTERAHINATLRVFDFSVNKLLFGNGVSEFNILNSDSGFASIVFSIGIIGYIIFVILLSKVLFDILSNSQNGWAGIAIVSLILGWFAALHFKSDVWSPMGNFILFFSAGLIARYRLIINKGRYSARHLKGAQ